MRETRLFLSKELIYEATALSASQLIRAAMRLRQGRSSEKRDAGRAVKSSEESS